MGILERQSRKPLRLLWLGSGLVGVGFGSVQIGKLWLLVYHAICHIGIHLRSLKLPVKHPCDDIPIRLHLARETRLASLKELATASSCPLTVGHQSIRHAVKSYCNFQI
jgi:hypothetical protein